MIKAHRKLYFTALVIILALSAYPLAMGARIVIIQLRHGSIYPEDYARYVIPYFAVSASVLLTVALFPLIARLKRYSLIAATILGVCLFVCFELYIENITINTPEAESTLTWQLYSCIGTTAAVKAFQRLYDDTFKIHYFLISFIIIVLVIGIVYGYGRMIATGDRSRKIILRLQLILTVLFLALCIVANFTGFFRDATEYLTPISSYLTGSFFVLLGVTAGVYTAGYFVGQNRLLSVLLPSVTAVIICSLMYYGEYRLLDGVLYRFGYSNLYQPLPYAVAAPIDLLIILITGAITAGLTSLARWLDHAYAGKRYRNNEVRVKASES